jgi:tellurium resistance protein TerD
MVNNAFIRCFDPAKVNENLCKYDLSEDFSTNTGAILGKLYRKDGEWKFQALGTPANGDINTICAAYFN